MILSRRLRLRQVKVAFKKFSLVKMKKIPQKLQ